jgi:hypothetical protein
LLLAGLEADRDADREQVFGVQPLVGERHATRPCDRRRSYGLVTER